MRYLFALSLILLIGLTVQAGELVTYQGRLTDSGGDPVANGTYALTFSLWDDSTGGTQQWTESHASVAVTNGLFSINLGKGGTLNASVFETEPLFLQIMVGYSDIITPRTRLTSAPTAVAAKKVSGDIETGEGSMVVKNTIGDSAIIIDAGSGGRGYPSLVINNMDANPLGPMIEMTTDPTASSRIKIHAAQPTFSGRVLLTAHQSDSSEIALLREGLVPHDDRNALQLKASSSGASFIMNNPNPDYFDQELIKINSDSEGGKFSLYQPGDLGNNPAFTIGLEPTPFKYPYLSFYDPLGSFPDNPSIKMGVEPSPFIEMHDASSGIADRPLMRMGFDPTPFHNGYLVFQNPDVGPPPKLMELGINDESGDWESLFRMYSIDPGDDERETFEISNSLTDGISIKMFNPQPEPPARLVEMKVEEIFGPASEWGSVFSMFLTEPIDKPVLEMSAIPSTGASFKMFNPQPEPPRVYFEINADQATGPSLGFHDDIGQVMGLDPSPFNEGFSMYLMDPVDDEKRVEIMANHVTDEASIKMMDPGDDENPAVEIKADLNGSYFNINRYDPYTATLFDAISMNVDGINSKTNFRLIEPGNDERPGFEMTASGIDNSASFRMMDPGDDGKSLILMNGNSNGGSIKMFNPQPEPPAMLFDLSVNVAKASDDIEMKLTSGDSLYQTKITPGRVKVGHPTNDLYPHSELNNGSDSATFFLQGLSAMVPAPPVVMMSSSSEAKMGIGTLTPNENLVVGNDLGSFGGKHIVIGDDDAGVFTGLIIGRSDQYHGWLSWSVDNDFMNLGTREGATTYANTIVMQSGTVGIGGTSSGSELHVNGDICYTGSIGACSDVRYKRDIRTIGNALDRVTRLRGVSFNWKKDKYPEYRFSSKPQVGLIAQEVKKVLPQVVSEDNNGYYNVDYTKLTPLLIEAIKELKQENEELKNRIDKLEAQ